jgi:hypothetical protein
MAHHSHMALYIIWSDGLFLQPSPDPPVLGFMHIFQLLEDAMEGYLLTWYGDLMPFADVIWWELEWFSGHVKPDARMWCYPRQCPTPTHNECDAPPHGTASLSDHLY